MKKFLYTTLLLFFAFLNFNSKAYAIQIYQLTPEVQQMTDGINDSLVGERVMQFNSDITINRDGSIDVRENIDYYFDTQRHGIYRYIPFTLNNNGKRLDMQFVFSDVVDENGNKYTTSTYKEGEDWVIRIGDPDRTITGNHTYIISYKIKGALRYFDDHDELYWNITGSGWNVPIRNTKVNISLPQEVSESDIKIDCFTGVYGENKNNCMGESNGTTATFETSKFLDPNQGLTIAYSFPKGVVEVLEPTPYISFFDRWYGRLTLFGIVMAGLYWYIFLPIFLVVKWFKFGRDPDVGIAVTAAYDPPKINKRDLTPAESGALLDEQVDKRDIFATIVDLARRGHLIISEQEKGKVIFKKTEPKKKDTLLNFEISLLNGLFDNLVVADISKIKFYPTSIKVEEKIYNSLVTNNYFLKNPKTTRSLYYVLGGFAIFSFNFVLAFVAFLFGRHMPAKTIIGAQTATRAKGLKNFLASQERQLNFQGDKQMLFEKLLPYAVAFGVEKQWAKRFEGFDLKNPDWYEGTSTTHFNTALLASSLSHSYSSFSKSSTPPSSSSSSGFGGGGFSGGGGGGGGGGSW